MTTTTRRTGLLLLLIAAAVIATVWPLHQQATAAAAEQMQGPNPSHPRPKLRLQGVIAAEETDKSLAIVSVESDPAQTYNVGQTIKGTDAVIREIHKNAMIIERDGLRERIYLNSLNKEPEILPVEAPVTQNASSPTGNAQVAPAGSPSGPTAGNGEDTGTPNEDPQTNVHPTFRAIQDFTKGAER